MAKRMLVDATHPEETRVAVVNGNRLEELDFETAAKRQLKGNIYLAKVTRVEPSLQAAFVEYGGNRHGFLAFSEIHPDYYRIPIADRQALVAQEAAESAEIEARLDAEADAEAGETGNGENGGGDTGGGDAGGKPRRGRGRNKRGRKAPAAAAADGGDTAAEPVDEIGGDEVEEVAERPRTRPLRSYKIQEVIKRRQIMLVQVTKEERGNKGAALTTYLSLAGRYCVLMPNTPRGGGVSRKIANPKDRKRMKAILDDLYIPDGMAVILRTAGMERTKAEIKRDLDYLLRLWDQIRAVTLESTAPTLIHEEANLIKRAIRDLYTKDIDEILVSGEQGYRIAKDFMRMLMPSHAKKVQLYKDETIPMFHRYQVETQIDAMHSQTVQLRSGGYIVINPTEALVAIDVNSGRSTRERNIEETAYKTNLEAAEEVARQLRLRDLAGLIVIDFIDMEDDRHNAAVERRLKEAMRTDRARIQLGRISPFGLMELSRQRLRPSLVETNFETCRHCGGAGVTRTIGSASLHVLRAIEEEGIRKRAREVAVHVPNTIALNILNQKRDSLAEIEARYGFRVYVEADDTLIAPDYRLERLRARTDDEESAAVDTTRIMAETDAALAAEAREEDRRDTVEDERAAEGDVEGRSKRRRKPRRRRKGDGAEGETAEARGFRPDLEEPDETGDETGTDAGDDGTGEDAEERGGDGVAATLGEDDADRPRKKRRRGKRGGRRRAVRGEGEGDELTARDSGETEGDDEEGDGREEDVREADARDTAWPEPGEAEAAGDTAARKPEAVTDAVEATEPAAEAEPSPAEPAPTPEAAAEPEAAEAQAAPAKPKRRRSPAKAATKTEGAAKPKRSRKKAVEAEPAEPAAAEAEPVPEAASDAADADSAAAEEKPKRKRAPRSRKKAEPTDAAETAGETAGETVAGKTADTAAAAETGEAPEKPKRKRPTRSRKKAEPAEAPTDTGATGAEPEAEAPAESPAPAAAETPANDAGAAADETDEGAGDHTNVIDVPEKPVDSTTADSKPRRGWWRRVIDR